MGWSIAAAAPGTSCKGELAQLISVVAYRVNDEGETQVLTLPNSGSPTWVPLEEANLIAPPGPG